MEYSVIVPLYNEEEVIEECYRRLSETMAGCGGTYELIFVNDGSRDRTMELARAIAAKDKCVKIISFSRNFGHQTAITAGMNLAAGAAVVVIDADLQDPPRVILDMIAKWKEGYEVVYGRRTKRKGETVFKKITAKLFYRTLNALTDVSIPVDTGDFRLLDRKAVEALKSLPERNRYVRGLVSWVGFRQTAVDYVRDERFAGETKYPLRKMLRFAADALTSFSYKPLKLSIFVGGLLSAASFVYLLVVLYLALFTEVTVAGWASLAAITLFFNGVVLIVLGIIGEYIGRIYDETKGRPLYIIGETAGFDSEKDKNNEKS
ncbi:MAG: glycosyltransferase family 2 protein [Oscillospiraceae bacterium]|nr:glycosyltransferase family 2 protein [Oscillospiraceae bacterium]